MKKKQKRKLKKAMRKLATGPAWVTALATIASAITSVLTDEGRRSKVKQMAGDAKARAMKIGRSSRDELPDGMVMDENPGPV